MSAKQPEENHKSKAEEQEQPVIEASAEAATGQPAEEEGKQGGEAAPEAVGQGEAPDETAAAEGGEGEEGLETALERARAEAQEYLDGWQRARAEFANYRKRVDREMQDAYERAKGDILARYLCILDDLERALKDRPAEDEAGVWAEGIELIYRKFKALLEAEGVETIPAEGQPFDPNLHEAISHEESGDHQEGHVIEVVQQGYRIGDRVLRPALVRVAK